MKEKWRKVPGNPRYMISSMGRMKGIDKKISKTGCSSGGYQRITLHRDGKRKIAFVHHLVALVFIGPRPPGYYVCHKNGNKQDNRVENLGYFTPKENSSHRVLHGTLAHGESHGCAKLTEDNVRFILDNYKPNDKKFSGATLAEMFGVKFATISKIICGRTWRHVHGSISPEADGE